MNYKTSDVDKKNFAAFAKDHSRHSLVEISLQAGKIRGLSKFSISFTYPLAAISGRNGSGKSTVLALAACAYHNGAKGWKLPGRKLPYYRFSDFFVQAQGEVPVEGVQITYGIRSDGWKPSDYLPNGVGLGHQRRHKNHGGKWNDYDTRLKRQVAFFGVERVVPPAERSVLKNQKQYFFAASGKKSDTEEAARGSVSRVLGIAYEDFELRGFGAHKLPHVRRHGCEYSGFNMGAGEQALFSLFLAIHSAAKPTLFVIDEIELGLHEAAQRHLIEELKNIAFKVGHQFIFTTHSPVILECLPPEARFFLENAKEGTRVTEGISAEYAAGRMAEKANAELVIYVEDTRAKHLLTAVLNTELRRRTHIVEVGSNGAVMSQANAKFIDRSHSKKSCLFILDGDQRSALITLRATFLKRVEAKHQSAAAAWIDPRIGFLPSDLSPERFLIAKIREDHVEAFAAGFGLDNEQEACDILDKALIKGNHSEIHCIAEDLSFPLDQVWQALCQIVAVNASEDFAEVLTRVKSCLING